jgi:N6-L-threonylcarbamoyladenine synthase
MIVHCLAIETSCDETSISIVKGEYGPHEASPPALKRVQVLAHVVHSQNSTHAPFGGVVPEMAARDHLSLIYPLAQKALQEARLDAAELDLIAVTQGPGLLGALMVGVLFAQGLSVSLGIPLMGINHVEAHLTPALLLSSFDPMQDLGKWMDITPRPFPLLGLTVSGGHCLLSHLPAPHQPSRFLGYSLDDACGEAFDKVGKLLGLPFPGGPQVELLAQGWQKRQLFEPQGPLPPPWTGDITQKQGAFMFSYSGLKTKVLEEVRALTQNFQGKVTGNSLSDFHKQRICYAFQKAALEQLIHRCSQARQHLWPHSQMAIAVAGGVAVNQSFRDRMAKAFETIYWAPKSLCTDNATMIALHALRTHPNPTNMRLTKLPPIQLFTKYEVSTEN